MKLSLMAGTSPFAHLLGGRGRAATKSKADEGEEKPVDKKDAKKAEGEDEDDTEKKGAKKADDEGGDDETMDEEDEDEKDDETEDDEDEQDESARKSKASDEEDDAGDKKKDAKKGKGAAAAPANLKAAVAKGRRIERARCAAIFKSEHAGANPAAAAHLAFETGLSAKNAIGVMAANAAFAPAPAKSSLRDRVQPNPQVGAGGGGGSEPTMAEQIVLAGKKRRGEV